MGDLVIWGFFLKFCLHWNILRFFGVILRFDE